MLSNPNFSVIDHDGRLNLGDISTMRSLLADDKDTSKTDSSDAHQYIFQQTMVELKPWTVDLLARPALHCQLLHVS